MARRDMHVTLTADIGPFIEQMNRVAAAFARVTEIAKVTSYDLRRAARRIDRLAMSPGDRHIDRVMREIATGVPGRDPAIRLQVASDLAQILDRSTP